MFPKNPKQGKIRLLRTENLFWHFFSKMLPFKEKFRFFNEKIAKCPGEFCVLHMMTSKVHLFFQVLDVFHDPTMITTYQIVCTFLLTLCSVLAVLAVFSDKTCPILELMSLISAKLSQEAFWLQGNKKGNMFSDWDSNLNTWHHTQKATLDRSTRDHPAWII